MSLGLTNDFIFKYVFGQEDNAPHLLALVNAVLEDSGFNPVVSLIMRNPAELKDSDWLKSSTLDIKAKDENGAEYDIEIQVSGEPNFKNRSLYYWSKLYANQLIKGDNYEELKPIICINIIDFDLFKNLHEFHTCFMLIDKKIADTVLTEDLQIHFIELKKAEKFTGKLAEIAMLIEKASPEMEESMTVLLQKNPIYQEVYNRYTHCIEDEITREKAMAREKFALDHSSRLHASYKEGKLEGLSQGITQGLSQGITQGLSQGISQAKLETARNFKNDGIPASIIAKNTGLTIAEVESL